LTVSIESAKVDEAVDCIESEATPASCSKELPGETEVEVDSGELLTVSREAMIPFESFKELLGRD